VVFDCDTPWKRRVRWRLGLVDGLMSGCPFLGLSSLGVLLKQFKCFAGLPWWLWGSVGRLIHRKGAKPLLRSTCTDPPENNCNMACHCLIYIHARPQHQEVRTCSAYPIVRFVSHPNCRTIPEPALRDRCEEFSTQYPTHHRPPSQQHPTTHPPLHSPSLQP